MRFTWATIHVRDLEKSLDFYTKTAGLSLNRRFTLGEGKEIAFLGSEGTSTELELIRNRDRGEPRFGGDISLGFALPDLEAFRKSLDGEGKSYEGPFEPGPGIKFLYVEDPDGLRIQFLQDSDPAAR